MDLQKINSMLSELYLNRDNENHYVQIEPKRTLSEEEIHQLGMLILLRLTTEHHLEPNSYTLDIDVPDNEHSLSMRLIKNNNN